MISLCMIVKNEQEFLEQCLSSVKELVDEIVIVDTGSADKTKEIAQKFGAKIYDVPWENDFAKARNSAIRHATGDWILILDADEVIASADHARIKELIAGDADGYYLIQRTYTNDSSATGWQPADDYDKRYGGFFKTHLIRLFKNNREIKYSQPVHESVKESIENMGGKLVKSTVPILHYGKVRGDDFVAEKSKVYEEIGEKKAESGEYKAIKELAIQQKVNSNFDEAIVNFEKVIQMNPKDSSNYVNLGAIYYQQQNLDRAEWLFEQALSNDGDLTGAYNLAIVYEKKGKTKSAVELLIKIVGADKKHIDAYFSLARIFTATNNLESAIPMLRNVVFLNPKNYQAVLNLAIICSRLKKYESADKYFAMAIELKPESPQVYFNQGVMFGVRDMYEDAEKAFRKCIELNPEIPQAYTNLAFTLKKMGKKEESEKLILETDKKFPGFIPKKE